MIQITRDMMGFWYRRQCCHISESAVMGFTVFVFIFHYFVKCTGCFENDFIDVFFLFVFLPFTYKFWLICLVWFIEMHCVLQSTNCKGDFAMQCNYWSLWRQGTDQNCKSYLWIHQSTDWIFYWHCFIFSQQSMYNMPS